MLGKAYLQTIWRAPGAVADVSLLVNQGDVVVILGPPRFWENNISALSESLRKSGWRSADSVWQRLRFG